MKARLRIWNWMYLLGLVLTVAICASASDHTVTIPDAVPGPPNGTPHWKYLSPGASPNAQLPQSRGFHGPTIVYHPGSGSSSEVILFGGRDSAKDNLNDVWILQNAEDYTDGGCPPVCWVNTVPNGAAGSPTARSGHSAVYDIANDRMIIFGGCSGYCEPTLNDVWVLINASTQNPTWMQLFPTGGPPGRRTKFGAAYDPVSNRMIIFAGQNGDGNGGDTYQDVWVLTNANGLGGAPAWIQLNPSGTIAAGQYGLAATYDSVNNILTVFGGSTHGASPVYTNSVSTLSHANGLGGTPAWNQPSISGSPPGARSDHTAVYDPSSNRMTIFGGENGLGDFSDVWVLTNANGMGSSSWIFLPTNGAGPGAVTPTARESHTAAYDPDTNVMMMFGGDGIAFDGWFVTPWVLLHANGQ